MDSVLESYNKKSNLRSVHIGIASCHVAVSIHIGIIHITHIGVCSGCASAAGSTIHIGICSGRASAAGVGVHGGSGSSGICHTRIHVHVHVGSVRVSVIGVCRVGASTT